MTQAFNLSQLANKVNTSGQINAATGLTNAVPVANGGTGATSLTSKAVLIGNGTSAPTGVSPSTSGNVLTSDGTNWVSTGLAVLGKGQSYTSVSKTWNTQYTNSTTRPIFVAIGVTTLVGTGSTLSVSVSAGSGSFVNVATDSGATNISCNMYAIVPPGFSYQLTWIGGPQTINYWSELS